MLAELLFRGLLLSHAAQISLFFRADAEGDVIMSQLSGNEMGMLSPDSLRKSGEVTEPTGRKENKK